MGPHYRREITERKAIKKPLNKCRETHFSKAFSSQYSINQFQCLLYHIGVYKSIKKGEKPLKIAGF